MVSTGVRAEELADVDVSTNSGGDVLVESLLEAHTEASLDGLSTISVGLEAELVLQAGQAIELTQI